MFVYVYNRLRDEKLRGFTDAACVLQRVLLCCWRTARLAMNEFAFAKINDNIIYAFFFVCQREKFNNQRKANRLGKPVFVYASHFRSYLAARYSLSTGPRDVESYRSGMTWLLSI